MHVLVVDAHGFNTPGKVSPDRSHHEWEWSRAFCLDLMKRVEGLGLSAHYINPETNDIPISVSAARANGYALQYGKRNCLLISPHNNAAPPNDGNWHNAEGFLAYVHTKASQQACRLAYLMDQLAVQYNLKGNRAYNREGFLRANFGILRETIIPAVLTENLYQDNKNDLAKLHDPHFYDLLLNIHVLAIREYVDNKLYL